MPEMLGGWKDMPITKCHCRLDISGGIKNARMWRNCITVDGRLLQTEKEVRAFFDWWWVYGTCTKSVTHWMPMPEPPEEGAGGDECA